MKTIHYHRLGLPLVLFLLSTGVFAQQNLGINNPTPDPSAVLDIAANDKGMLIPRLDSVQRVQISSPAQGLLVYQNDGLQGFWYYQAPTGWLYLNPNAADNLGNHTATTTLNLQSNASPARAAALPATVLA